MIRIIIVCLLVCTNSICSQAQTVNYNISSLGYGSIKLDMSLTELKKVVDAPNGFTFKNLSKGDNSYYFDTVKFYYNDILVEAIIYNKRIYNGTTGTDDFRLYGFSVTAPGIQTKSGIGIGSDIIDAVKTYLQYPIDLQPKSEWFKNPEMALKFYKEYTTIRFQYDESSKKINKITVAFLEEGC